MRQNGAPFSKIIQFDNQEYYFKQNNQLFTLEIYVTGIEEREFTKANCMSLAKLCGKPHRISEDINFQFGYDGAWLVDFEKNYCDDEISEKEQYFIEMINCLKECYYDEVLLNKVTDLFEKKMKELKNDLKSLPKGPTQGDLGLDNVRFNEQHESIAVFDYNIAGDEVYVGEFVNQIAWYQEFIKEDVDLKSLMLASYESERILTYEYKSR